MAQASRLATAVCVAAALLAGGCTPPKQKVTVIKDDSLVRMDEAQQLASEAQAAQKAGDGEKAIALYQQSLSKTRDLFYVWNNLGTLLMERQNYMDAAECFTTAADLAPMDPRPFYNMGVIYQRALHDQKALEYYVKSLDRDPRYLPSLRGAVITAKRLDISDEALLDRIRSGLLQETNPEWRRILETELLRVEGSMMRSGRQVPGSGASRPSRPVEPPAAAPAAPAPAPAVVPQNSPTLSPQPIEEGKPQG